MTCPKCRGAMASRLVAVDNGGWWSGTRLSSIEIDVCGACGGAWFDSGEWAAYLRRRVENAPRPPKLTEANRKLLDARIATCPRCSLSLEKRTHGRTVVDVCETCGGLWLDGGEYPTEPRVPWEKRIATLLGG